MSDDSSSFSHIFGDRDTFWIWFLKPAFAPDIYLCLFTHKSQIVKSTIILKALESANIEKHDPCMLYAYYLGQGSSILSLFYWQNLRGIEKEDISVTNLECVKEVWELQLSLTIMFLKFVQILIVPDTKYLVYEKLYYWCFLFICTLSSFYLSVKF